MRRIACARALLVAEWRHLATLNASDRPWQMPLAAATATGAPLLLGAWHDALAQGLVASLGGLVFLYLPATRLSHRMAWLMACAFGMVASYTLGILSHAWQPLTVPVLALIAIVVSMVCRFYSVPPPGSLFFIMAAAIGAYTPPQGAAAVLNVGLLALGCVFAVAIAFGYSLHVLRTVTPAAALRESRSGFDFVVLDSVVIGLFVGVALAIAQLLQLERPYWVPVSCLAVIQGASLRAVWTRQLQRIVGTAAGLVLFWALSALPLDAWSVALILTALTFVIETLVVHSYALAVVFITPFTILLAEAPHLASSLPHAVMRARLADTVLGCAIGLAGAACLHSPALRRRLGPALRGLLPQRLGD